MRLRLRQQLQFPVIFCIVILDVVLPVIVMKQLDVHESKLDIRKREISKLFMKFVEKSMKMEQPLNDIILPFQHSNELIEWGSIYATYHCI